MTATSRMTEPTHRRLFPCADVPSRQMAPGAKAPYSPADVLTLCGLLVIAAGVVRLLVELMVSNLMEVFGG